MSSIPPLDWTCLQKLKQAFFLYELKISYFFNHLLGIAQ